MVSPPWEPYPERKRKLERRARRPRNKHNTQPLNQEEAPGEGRRKKKSRHGHRHPATDSSFSSSSSTDYHTQRGGGSAEGGYDIDSVASSHGFDGLGSLEGGDSHTRVRPDDCWCLRDGGCGDEDGCCVEDLAGEVFCPCFSRISTAVVLEDKLEVGTCGVCLEDGKQRTCCHRYYCKLCYEGTGNCPGCQLITVGANRGLLASQKDAADSAAAAAAAATPLVRDGEECRVCLRQGFARKCCGEFYCSDCYFRGGHCPSCQTPAEKRIRYQRIPHDPGVVPVLVGFFATVLVTLAVVAGVSVAIASNNAVLSTVFDQTCYGFFPSCITDPKCVVYDSGDLEKGLEPITEWSVCNDETTVNKIYGSYCIFDEEVFVNSKEKWGFDFCVDEFVPSAGAYVFEDTFEMWSSDNLSSNTLASARWDHVTNGRPSDVCGIGNGAGTMMFSGANFREVETLDMDMRYGGKLVFLMKMGPSVADSSTALCKPAYGGNVYLYYSLDGGTVWETLTILETFAYRAEEFTEVEVEVSPTLNTYSVRFKWKQENFENALEYWALDDVRVVSYFAEGWRETATFESTVDTEQQIMREIRCCLNSEQCDLSKRRQDAVDCSQYITETSSERALLGAELFVVLAGLVALARSLYRTCEGMVLEGWEYAVPAFLRKKRSKIFLADDPVPGSMNKIFRLDVNLRWQFRFIMLVGVPLAVCWLYCAALLRNFYLVEELTVLPDVAPTTVKLKVHVSGLFLLATFTDVHSAFLLARDVVCVLPIWVPKVDVDLRPSASWLRIGTQHISLEDIKDTEMFSRTFCVWLAAGYVTGVMPWCLVALILKYSYIPYGVSRYVTVSLGAVVLVRAWLGPEWVIKVAYSVGWLLTMNILRRDDIGNAFIAEKTKHLVLYCAVFGTLLTMGLLQLFNTRSFAIVSVVALAMFAFYGLGLSVVQGLPLTPNFRLTTISRGVMLRIHRRVLCPCERRLDQCGGMHSRDELVCVFVRDALIFSEMLRGDDTVE
ncbi:unnamed protein product [Pylaiella littoralis]